MTGEEVVPVQPQRFGTPEGSPHTMEQWANPTATARAAGRASEQAARGAMEEVDGPKAVARAEKRAAKQAARRIAALEKKEARERKALAKAARRKRA
jgi:16S rRNA U1498 N3-methylase RsmE